VARTTEANRPSLIGYTGSVNEEDRARCLASGMAEVLMKPLERAALAAALTRAKRLRGRRRSSSSGSVEAMVPVLDESVYEKLVVGMGHAEDVREMARDLLAELGPRVKKIREGLLGADRVTMRREAHKLASAVATFGGTRLALACRRLEVTAETESFSLLEARVAEIESRNADFAPALERMMQAT
jgi:HPt (histidine-containing phosphotransfer) domain-containing protein